MSCCLWQYRESTDHYGKCKCILPAAGTMGINQACRNKEMAREFILFVLGRDVQSKDLSDGLPVNALAARDWVGRENTSGTSIAVSGADGYELTGSWPTKEERLLVFDTAAGRIIPFGWTGF